MSKQTVSLITLGCAKNQVDSEYIAAALQKGNHIVYHERETADIVLINTCGFIHDAKEQSVDTILQYVEKKKMGSIKKLIVFGCLTERHRNELSIEIPEVDLWFGVNDSALIIQHLNKTKTNSGFDRLLSTPSHYAFLKISEGCDRTCSFCAIPGIRGVHRSKPIEDLLLEAKMLVQSGVKELIVIAQDTTYYGIDIYGKRMLGNLLEQLSLHSGAEWIRLHYAYPAGFPDDVIDIMAKYDNICKYIDIPLQHVNNELLKSMRRQHTTDDIEMLLQKFRQRIPGIHIRTTFIAGYPGETTKQFNELLTFIRKQRFEKLGVFAYSEEEHTHAATLNDDVPHRVKIRRMQQILDLQERISKEINVNRIGQTLKIIIDEEYPDYLLGRSQFDSPDVDNLVTVHCKKGHSFQPGDSIQVKITGAGAYDLIAEPAETV